MNSCKWNVQYWAIQLNVVNHNSSLPQLVNKLLQFTLKHYFHIHNVRKVDLSLTIYVNQTMRGFSTYPPHNHSHPSIFFFTFKKSRHQLKWIVLLNSQWGYLNLYENNKFPNLPLTGFRNSRWQFCHLTEIGKQFSFKIRLWFIVKCSKTSKLQ